MSLIIIDMEVRPAKCKELLIAIQELTEVKRSEQGFCGTRVCQDSSNGNHLTIFEEWDTAKDVEAYLQSDYFHILLGGIKILTSSASLEYVTASGQKEHTQIHGKSAGRSMHRVQDEGGRQ